MHNELGRDELLKRLSILDFVTLDMGLYLNVNPHDAEALSIHAQVSEDAEKLRNAFEKTYGPLTSRYQAGTDTDWKWINDPWPWELV